MDVDKIQKINDLALELMKQGIAKDKEEAVRQAEKILSKKDYSTLRESVNEIKGEIKGPAPEEKKQNQEKTEEEKTEELTQNEIKEILEKNTNFIVKKMKENQELVESLKGEISILRKEVDGLKGRIISLRVASQPQKEGEKRPQQKLASSQSPKEGNPRSGNYKDTDVSIEKFFYSGSKPKA